MRRKGEHGLLEGSCRDRSGIMRQREQVDGAHWGTSQDWDVAAASPAPSTPSGDPIVWFPTKTRKFTVGAPPMEGDRGHSAALMKDERSSLFRTWFLPPPASRRAAPGCR